MCTESSVQAERQGPWASCFFLSWETWRRKFQNAAPSNLFQSIPTSHEFFYQWSSQTYCTILDFWNLSLRFLRNICRKLTAHHCNIYTKNPKKKKSPIMWKNDCRLKRNEIWESGMGFGLLDFFPENASFTTRILPWLWLFLTKPFIDIPHDSWQKYYLRCCVFNWTKRSLV